MEDVIKRQIFEKGYYDIDSVPKDKALGLIDKEYVQRHLNYKSFQLGNKVLFDKFTNEGIVNGFGGGMVTIYGKDGLEYNIHNDKVFLKEEVLRFGHWDTMSEFGRTLMLKGTGLSTDLAPYNWKDLAQSVKSVLLKIASPAGYEGNGGADFGTSKPGAYNPVSENKPLSQRLEEDEKKD